MVLRNAARDRSSHPKARVIAVHSLCVILIGVDVFDGAGLTIGGDRLASTPTYDVLRLIPGGMRTYGIALLLGAVALAWAITYGRWLQTILSLGVGYYLMWAVCIPMAWWHAHNAPTSWPAVSKYALMATLYFVCARAVAPPRRRR